MDIRRHLREHLLLVADALRWILIVTPLAIAVGSACALFLWALSTATATRHEHPWLLYLLPLAGMLIVGLYRLWGRSVEAGNNLIMDEIHAPGGGVPWRMAPLILITTVLTHLFGGSAGREGTAVQMGGSLAGGAARLLNRFTPVDTRIVLMAGVAAGFGGVFGTPLAGTIFALEVLVIGRISYEAVIPCLMAAILSDWTASAWGAEHVHYQIVTEVGTDLIAHLDLLLLAKVALAAILFGLVSVLFAELTHGLSALQRRFIAWPLLRPVVGGVAVIALVWLLGTRDYLGLGIDSPDEEAVTILSSFQPGGAEPWSWWWKLLFTAVTLSAGFRGGEVTPLFFIGAALGNTLAWILGAPTDLMAALGFVAVFAAATNTPLACTIMAVELFGTEHVIYFATACFLAYLFSGHTGIYSAQRIGTTKSARLSERRGVPLRRLRPSSQKSAR